MFDRFITLIGEENFKLIENTSVLLLGVGGVGGYVAEALVRSGIKKLTIVDDDNVELTNLNRQIIALHSTIGLPKVEVMKTRLEDINPSVYITPKKIHLEENLDDLDFEKYDYIVDCIDDVPVKVSLAKKALDEGLNLIMSTGTAKKLDPSKLMMTTLAKTSHDPLARKLRHLLRGYDTKKVIVLSSSEAPIICTDNVLGSSAFVPSTGGLLIASYVIKDIIK